VFARRFLRPHLLQSKNEVQPTISLDLNMQMGAHLNNALTTDLFEVELPELAPLESYKLNTRKRKHQVVETSESTQSNVNIDGEPPMNGEASRNNTKHELSEVKTYPVDVLFANGKLQKHTLYEEKFTTDGVLKIKKFIKVAPGSPKVVKIFSERLFKDSNKIVNKPVVFRSSNSFVAEEPATKQLRLTQILQRNEFTRSALKVQATIKSKKNKENVRMASQHDISEKKKELPFRSCRKKLIDNCI
jgi:hypothetical protein